MQKKIVFYLTTWVVLANSQIVYFFEVSSPTAQVTGHNTAGAADPGGAGRPKFKQLEMVTTSTYKPSLVRIDARNFELWW